MSVEKRAHWYQGYRRNTEAAHRFLAKALKVTHA
jgi:hypothetical protein